MADSDSGSQFGDLIDQLIRDRDDGIGDDDQSDLSDLSDFDEFLGQPFIRWTMVGQQAAKRLDSCIGRPSEADVFQPNRPRQRIAVQHYFLQLFPNELFEKIVE